MLELIAAFFTGLTTGGLSCLAVQGGLLASSLAQQVEGAVFSGRQAKAHPKLALPIFLFLSAKLAAYTLLGFLLGWVGSYIQLSPLGRAVLLIAVGIFMVGSALRLLNVHPIFRYFVIEPPRFITRYIRRTSQKSAAWFSPVFLGALTVLIPCGITQAMMAAAIASGDALRGAALMFAFTLGTSPVFFAVAYLATRLGAAVEKYFNRLVAVVILLLALVTINSGLNLIGSPLAFERWFNRPAPIQAQQPDSLPSSSEGGEELVTIQVKNSGYVPERVAAKAGVPVTLKLVSKDVYSCSLAFVIPALKVERMLEPTGEAVIAIPPQKPGTVIPFSCSMGMYTGEIVFN